MPRSQAPQATGFGVWGKALAAEPPPEITTIRFEKDTATCIAPQVFQELLRAEGFTDIRYVDFTEAHTRRADAANSGPIADMIAHGEVDFAREFAPNLMLTMNAGGPVTVLSGLHLGCFELFGKNEIRSLGDLKGRTVGTDAISDQALLTIMTRLVGLEPAKDFRWVTDPSLRPMDLFVEGKIDAFLTLPPNLQEVRARNVGHGVLPGPGMARINRATCSGSSSWTKCRAPGIRNSSEPGRNRWNDRATPLFREGSASPKMIRTGRLNSFSLGIICVRDWTMGNKSSFRRKKAGRTLGVASNC